MSEIKKESLVYTQTIQDKGSKAVTKFTVLTSPEKNDSISNGKMGSLSGKLKELIFSNGKIVELKLKETVAGNNDEGKPEKIGKALRIKLAKLRIDIFSQKPDSKWILSHSHIVDKDVFLAYTVVSLNDATAEEELKKMKNSIDETFGIND